MTVIVSCAPEPFTLWLDPPGSPAYEKNKPAWYDLIETSAGQSFESGDVHIEVNMGQHGAIHGFADPSFLNSFDQKIRDFNGALASESTGTLDRCGWPNLTATEAPSSIQYHRSSTPMVEDFSNGFTPNTMVVSLVKGCCGPSPLGRYGANLGITYDADIKKNVLALTAINEDDPNTCGSDSDLECHKIVQSSGTVATANLTASGRYEVIAKVPASPGLVWAVWTFHYSEHLPSNCANFTCYCSNMPSSHYVEDQCAGNEATGGCKYPNVCNGNSDGWQPDPEPPAPLLSPYECGQAHQSVGADPQFLGNNSFGGWNTEVNHEIDIEIPANCEGTSNVCNKPSWIKGSETCEAQYHTVNLNNYAWTQNSGTGPAYSNMCINATNPTTGAPHVFVGDGKYHNYTIDWHTGDGKGNNKYVDTYIDGIFLGRNNAFVPTRAGRLYIAHWGETSKNRLWAGWPDNWGGGKPGDGESYESVTYISEVRVTPYNEPGDIMAASTSDKPDGCEPNYHEKYPGVCHPRIQPTTISPP